MIRLFLSIACCIMIAACSRGPGGGGEHVTGQLSDRVPADWSGRAPHHYAVHGIDVARFQDQVDWHAASRAGVNFAFVKATEGSDRVDPRFGEHWSGARRAGIHRGAYHFYYFCKPAEVQAQWFIRNVSRERGMLPPVLDMEWNPYSPTCRYRPPAETVRAEAKIFLDMLERHYGQRPILYTTPDFYHRNDMGRLRGVEFWLRSTANHPDERYPGQHWAFWQYSGTGIVPGISGDVDLNTFAGSKADWENWLARRRH